MKRYFLILWFSCFSQVCLAVEIKQMEIAELKERLILSTAKAELSTVPLNKMFSMFLRIDRPADEAGPINFEFTRIDATMPAHKHGMVVKPKIRRMSPSKWRIDGFKLHMKGAWRFELVFKASGREVREVFELEM